tara:strand:- start:24418 stop:25527 length:1110 start_codon:yes stop_codon:yes gene_type:complete
MQINFNDLNRQYILLKNKIDTSISDVLSNGRFIQGPQVKELEEKLKDYTSTNTLTVANGTDALFIALRAMGVKEGDEVITPSFTWVSTVETIKLTGATPVFIDINEDTFNLDESLLDELITVKTKVILPVSLFGRCPNLEKIVSIAKEKNIYTLEDAAQSFGAKRSEKLSCSIADISTTSFFPSKPLGCYGDGGAIFTNNASLFDEVSMISKHGQKGRYNYLRVGVNSRLDTIQAAVLLEKMKVFEDEILLRNKVASKYNDILSESSLIKCPSIPNPQNRSVWAQYTILLDKKVSENRSEIMTSLADKKIPSALYYPAALHLQKPYLDDVKLPITEEITSRILSLPMHPYLADDEIEHVSETLLNILGE